MTPVLAALPVDSLIWIVLLLIGAISSIASNVRKARGTVQKMQTRQAPAPQLRPVPVPVPQVAVPTPPPPIVPRRVVSAPTPPAPTISTQAPVQAHGTRGFRGMFERGSLVRAIVAAEVLGPPKALQEQSIWSPRHSEPSI